jgi:hypothetical protein
MKECKMPKKLGFKPGEKAPRSGQYRIRGPGGKKEPERTVVRGEPFPPNP